MKHIIKAGALVLALMAPATAFAQQPDQVKLGWLKSLTDSALYVAISKGYFAEEKIEIVPTQFASGANMVVPLGTGELDVGAGSPSAGLYNAVARGIKIFVTADKTRSSPGFGGAHLVVRKDLVDSGRYKMLKDIKGFKFATSGPGNSAMATFYYALTSVGLKFSDISTVNLSYPTHITALSNKAVDASFLLEPFASAVAAKGIAVRVDSDDRIDPNHQLAAILFSGKFATRRDVAVRFLRAYLRGVSFYLGALKDGKLAGANAEEMIKILIANTTVKDPNILRTITPSGVDPDGTVNQASLQKDLDFYASEGWIKGKVDLNTIVDQSFIKEAVRTRRK